ncbi:hypothetical protein ACJJTC_003993 [Scirpophaga incertulas]
MMLSFQINTEGHVCHECWTLVNNALYRSENVQIPIIGHRQVCVNCGRSLVRTRSHRLLRTSNREIHVYNVIAEWIIPNQVQSDSHICHPCWMRASEHQYSAPSTSQAQVFVSEPDENENFLSSPATEERSTHNTPPDSPQQLNTINLPNYVRAVVTENRCIFFSCEDQHRFIVPLSVRKHLLSHL